MHSRWQVILQFFEPSPPRNKKKNNVDILSPSWMNRSQHYIAVGRERAKQLPFAGEPIKFPECPKTFISDCTRCTKFLKNNQKRYIQRNELISCLEPNKMIVEKIWRLSKDKCRSQSQSFEVTLEVQGGVGGGRGGLRERNLFSLRKSDVKPNQL